jgi:hypothetical protein
MELTLNNCIHLGPDALVQSLSGSGKPLDVLDVLLNHVTVYGSGTVDHTFPHVLDEAVPIRIRATNSYLVPQGRQQPLLSVRYQGQPSMLMPKVLWAGAKTLCPANATMIEVRRGPEQVPWYAGDFTAWRKYWGTHSTGLLGAPIPCASTIPDNPLQGLKPPGTEHTNLGAEPQRLFVPVNLDQEQLELLMERLKHPTRAD